jgi:hypothetical protein
LCLLLSASIRRAPVLRRQGTQEKMNWGDLDWWGSDWHLFLDALLHRHLVWLRPGLLPLLFFLWRVHVRMALGDVIASMPLVKQGLFFTCRGGALASLATGVRQCKCVCVCVNQSLSTLPLAGNRGSRSGAGGRRNTGRGDVFLLCCRLFWLRPWLLSSVFILWRVHVKMALGDVIASMPLVKQGLFVVCRGGALASLAYSLCVRSKQFRRH